MTEDNLGQNYFSKGDN